MAGSNLNSEVTSTLWIRETQPVPAGTQGQGLAISASCTGTPPTTAGIFAHGCMMLQTDTSTGTKALYENTGSSASPVWNLIGDSTVGEITLARGSVIVGNASGVGAAVDAKTSGRILVGDGTDLLSVAVSGDVALAASGATTVTDLTIASEARGDLLRRGASAWERVSAKDSGKFLIGDGTDVISATMSGDATVSAAGAVTIAAGAVTNAKVADSAGTSALGIRKSATVVYDFAVDGGAQGAIALTGSPTIPDNAVVWVESYDVLTTLTSAADTATVKLGLATDGDLTTAIAINDGTNPWDAGVFSRIAGGLATPLTKKTTGARTFVMTVATQDLTAGKICFQVAYWVSA